MRSSHTLAHLQKKSMLKRKSQMNSCIIFASLYLLTRVASALNSYIHLTIFEITLSVLQFNRSCLLGPFCLACQSSHSLKAHLNAPKSIEIKPKAFTCHQASQHYSLYISFCLLNAQTAAHQNFCHQSEPGIKALKLSSSVGASHFGGSGIPLGCTNMDRGPGVQTSV